MMYYRYVTCSAWINEILRKFHLAGDEQTSAESLEKFELTFSFTVDCCITMCLVCLPVHRSLLQDVYYLLSERFSAQIAACAAQ